MKLHLALAAATCLAMPLAAHAQPVTGPYVSLEGGTSFLGPARVNFRGVNVAANAQFKNSYAGTVSAGYGFGNGVRVEIAGNFYRNYASKLGGDRLRGGSNTYGPMVNVLYDLPLNLPIFPYVGIGAGYQEQHFDSRLKDSAGAESINVSGSKGTFAYNVILGMSYPIAVVPGLSLTAEYKFMSLVDSRNYSSNLDGPIHANIGPANVDQEFSHTVQLGIRYQLFQPPAPAVATAAAVQTVAPAAAPAPAPAKTYLVFFDWDKYNLTPRAVQIIGQAAQDSHTNNVTTLNVSGYTDTSGTPRYNQGLSERRAQAVAAQLVSDGVSQSEISIHAYGETHLLVPTGPGVREPQNRRVEIVLQ